MINKKKKIQTERENANFEFIHMWKIIDQFNGLRFFL